MTSHAKWQYITNRYICERETTKISHKYTVRFLFILQNNKMEETVQLLLVTDMCCVSLMLILVRFSIHLQFKKYMLLRTSKSLST